MQTQIAREPSVNVADCYARLTGDELTVGNDLFERRWRIADNTVIASSVLDRQRHLEWLAKDSQCAAWHHPELMLKMLDVGSASLTLERDDLAGAAAAHLRADLVFAHGSSRQIFRFRIWPGLPLVLQSVVCQGDTADDWTTTQEPELVDTAVAHHRPSADRVDAFYLAERQLHWTATSLQCRTDHRDNFVETTSGVAFSKQTIRRSGHLMHLGRWDGSAGLAAMKIAPPPDEQLHVPGWDFALSGGNLAICGGGVSLAEMLASGSVEAYRAVVAAVDADPASAAELFRKFMNAVAPPRVPRSGVTFANNWGGGGSVGIISEEFVSNEIKAAGRLGVTNVQIDAGWHQGDAKQLHVEALEPASTSQVDPNFWAVNSEKFPQGFEPIQALAKEQNVNVGVWYCLDRADHYAKWREDLATMLGLWRSHGITQFKIDGMSLSSRQAEANVLNLFRELFVQSGGEIAITHDITGGKSRRLGNCYAPYHIRDYFLENRYSRVATYWPHRTLRNLWQLAPLIPTHRFEVEWMDPSKHTEPYGDHPLAPAQFGIEYCLTVTLFARPLAWMHLQKLPPKDAAKVRKLLHAYLPHQHDMLTGRVDPIGEVPSGAAWTGFCSQHEREAGYLMLFREVNDRSTAAVALPKLPAGATLQLERIIGQGSQRKVKLNAERIGKFNLAKPRSFALYRWQLSAE